MAFQSLLQYKVLILSAIFYISRSSALAVTKKSIQDSDLKTSASSYSRQYYDWAGSYPGGYDYIVSGNTIENYVPRDEGYTNPIKDGNYPGKGYYVGQDYSYQKPVHNDGIQNYNGGYGGYGGFGGNGGLNSYYGYNNPYYQGANHLGYGYYNKKIGYGSIYNNGITPNLVTGYRGYTRR